MTSMYLNGLNGPNDLNGLNDLKDTEQIQITVIKRLLFRDECGFNPRECRKLLVILRHFWLQLLVAPLLQHMSVMHFYLALLTCMLQYDSPCA